MELSRRWERTSSFAYPVCMPRRTKEAPGRVTPKADARPTFSGRYTAPLPTDYRHSPMWVPVIMLAFFACGVLMIVLNYISLLPSAPSNWYLLGGLGLIVCGFAISTQYR
jgi:hypothetical protein